MFASVVDPRAEYPRPPFAPGGPFPEFGGLDPGYDPHNRLFGMLRELLHSAGCDADRFGTPDWNPLGPVVRGRRRIVIKPNLVLHKVGELSCSITVLSCTPR